MVCARCIKSVTGIFRSVDADLKSIKLGVAEIEEILKYAKVIKNSGKGKVQLGSVVELKLGKKTPTYTVVGPVEANPLESKISNESPIGKALMGKRIGDSVEIETPKGKLVYEIISLK